jgi:ABC-type spermidine/putrescine transport system permease subunit II
MAKYPNADGTGSRDGGNLRDLKIVPTIGFRSALFLLVPAIIILAVFPSLYSILWSILGTETLGVLSSHPTGQWFREILTDPAWHTSILYSVVLSLCASALSTVALVLHFYFVRYAPPLPDRLAYLIIGAVALIPMVVYALALRSLSVPLHLPEWALLLLGQFATVIPLQFFILESIQEVAPNELLFAGSTLGATHLRNIAWVYWPAIKEGALSAFVVGVFIAFDELVLASFVIDSRLVTAPRRLWDQINSRMDPAPAVVSCLLGAAFVLCTVMFWVWTRLRGRSQGGSS